MGCILEEGFENFSTSSIPWNDLYITAASIACLIAMLIDFSRGIYYRKPWYPSKIFSLNATALTLLDIATKQPADLRTPMPTVEEQFTKLSGAALICVAMGHFMPSLGPMRGSDLILNVLPLGILVLTVMGKVCIQIRTGVIHAFLPEHIFTLCVMAIMLLITCSAALTVPTMKQSLKQQYESKREQASSVGPGDHEALSTSMHTVKRFKADLRKYWMMALSCNPQYVLSRSCLGTATDLFCDLEFFVVIQAFIRTLILGSVPPRKWSVMLIMFTQVAALVVGILPSSIRRFAVVAMIKGDFRAQAISLRPRIARERYWIKVFEEWEDNPPPLAFSIRRRGPRRWIHDFKSKILVIIRWQHIILVCFTKFLLHCTSQVALFMAIIQEKSDELRRRLSSSPVLPFSASIREKIEELRRRLASLPAALFSASIREIIDELRRPLVPAEIVEITVLDNIEVFLPSLKDALELLDHPELKEELKKFVLHLEGEDEMVDEILKFCYLKAEKWIQGGRNKSLTHLAGLLKKSISLESFEEVGRFNSNHVSSAGSGSDSEETVNCWALPLVTLTSIAAAISCPEENRIKSLLNEVSEGLKYARLVDEKLDLQDLPNVRKAADIVWLGIDLYQRWLDEDLAALASEAKDPMKVIEQLAEKGETCVTGFENSMVAELPPRVFAGYSMHKICHIILRKYTHLDGNGLFELLHCLISDMMVACLTRLPRVLFSELHDSCIEEKDDSVREAACLLGEVERIIQVVGKKENEDLVIDQCKFIDFWRSFILDFSSTPCLTIVTSAPCEIV